MVAHLYHGRPLPVPRPSKREIARALAAAVVGVLATAGAPLVLGAGLAAASGSALRTSRGCYLVGQAVIVSGSGFAPNRTFDLTDDGVDFGQASTNGSGAFSASFRPGGLGAGIAQTVELLNASDGTSSANATFTLTRPVGARFLASGGNPHTLKARFQVWAFARDGVEHTVYVHYVSPSGHARATVTLGHTGGQCGYLLTGPRRVFPFAPKIGNWTLQVDTRRAYARHPAGAVYRIRVRVS
jgi:hypothetical protein